MSTHPQTTDEHWLNPDVLKWAREWRGRSLEDAAAKLKKPVEVVEAWERGEKTPTVNQARELAKYYDRHFLELVLDHLPDEPEPTSMPVFRTHRDVDLRNAEWEVQDAVRWVEAQRYNALDLLEDMGEEPPAFPGHLAAKISDSAEQVAETVRTFFEFPIEEQTQLTQKEATRLPAILRRLFESFGTMTLRKSGMGEFGIRGIAIVEFPLPTIAIANEAPTAQVFSLAHELGHVLLGQSAVSGKGDPTEANNGIEAWCNRFAAAFLMPTNAIEDMAGPRPGKPEASIDDLTLRRYANALRVSQHAMLIRLVQLGYVQRSYYQDVKRAEFEVQESRNRGGGAPEYYGVRYRSAQGDLYTGLVLEAWGTDLITGHNAAEFMGIKNLNHFYDIAGHFGDS